MIKNMCGHIFLSSPDKQYMNEPKKAHGRLSDKTIKKEKTTKIPRRFFHVGVHPTFSFKLYACVCVPLQLRELLKSASRFQSMDYGFWYLYIFWVYIPIWCSQYLFIVNIVSEYFFCITFSLKSRFFKPVFLTKYFLHPIVFNY